MRLAEACLDPIRRRLGATSPPVLVVGTGRCGTGYVGRVLSDCGLRAGHERVFTPRGVKRAWRLDVEVSWLAYPHADGFRGRIFHVVRDPIRVMRSFLELGFFSPDHESRYKRYASRFFAFSGDEVRDAMRWYVQLNARFEQCSEFRFRVEDPADGIARIVAAAEPRRAAQVAEAIARTGRSVNAKKTSKASWARRTRTPFTAARLDDLPPGPELDRLRAMAASYGYDC